MILPRKLTVGELYGILDDWAQKNITRSKQPYLIRSQQASAYLGFFKQDPNFSFENLEQTIKKTYEDNSYGYHSPPKIEIDGELFDEDEKYLDDYNVFDQDNFVLEIKSTGSDFKLKTKAMSMYAKCGYCSNNTKLKLKCPCGEVTFFLIN